MNVGPLVAALDEAGLEVEIETLLDALWLAQLKRSITLGLHNQRDEGTELAPTLPQVPGGEPAPAGSPDGEVGRRSADSEPGSPAHEPIYVAAEPTPGDRTKSAAPVGVPAARALPDRLAIMKAMRPFRQRRPSPVEVELDEEATAELTARLRPHGQRHLYPVFRPRMERWLEVDLILEDDDAVELWRDALRELAQVLRDSGAFRAVRLWRLRLGEVPGTRAVLEAPTGATVPATRPFGTQRLVLFATHGASRHWRGDYADLLASLARETTLALLHLLPRKDWKRTPLGEPQGTCRAPYPGAVTGALEIETNWWLGVETDDPSLLALPATPLEPQALGRLASMAMARGQRSEVVLIDRAWRGEELGAVPPDDDPFVRTAILRENSPEAHRLASMLLSCGRWFSIPVARLVQEACFGRVNNAALAELLLSGVVVGMPTGAGQLPNYAIDAAAEPHLRRGTLMSEQEAGRAEIRERVTEHIARIAGREVNLEALRADVAGGRSLPIGAEPFAEIVVALGNRNAARSDAGMLAEAVCNVEIRGQPTGCGVLISRRHVLTCAHLLSDIRAGREDGEGIGGLAVRFQGSRPISGRVALWRPRTSLSPLTALVPGAEDLAVIALEEVPGGVDPVPFEPVAPGSGAHVLAFGIDLSTQLRQRSPTHLEGRWLFGQVAGQSEEGVLVDWEEGGTTNGWSGSPVWDEAAGALVGLVAGMRTERKPEVRQQGLLVELAKAAPLVRNAMSDRQRSVWVVGSGSIDLASETVAHASSLGRALAAAGIDLLIGGWPGVDHIVAREFMRACEESRRKRRPVVRQVLEGDASADLAIPGEPLRTPSGRWLDAIEHCCAVILVGGLGAGSMVEATARSKGRPFIPVPGSGGEANRLAAFMLARRDFPSGVDARGLRTLAGQDTPAMTAEVAVDLAWMNMDDMRRAAYRGFAAALLAVLFAGPGTGQQVNTPRIPLDRIEAVAELVASAGSGSAGRAGSGEAEFEPRSLREGLAAWLPGNLPYAVLDFVRLLQASEEHVGLLPALSVLYAAILGYRGGERLATALKHHPALTKRLTVVVALSPLTEEERALDSDPPPDLASDGK